MQYTCTQPSQACHPALEQEDSAAKLPPPLPPSGEALKDPPKEVALLQDEETLFLDEDTLPAEVCSMMQLRCQHGMHQNALPALASFVQLLMEHHKEHWVAVRGWHQANIQRELKRWERRLGTLLPAYPAAVGLPSPPASMPHAAQMAASSGQ